MRRAAAGFAIACAVLLTPVVVFNLMLMVIGLIEPGRMPELLGYSPLIVRSDSMAPLIRDGDLIIVEQAEPLSLRRGDVIAYRIDDVIVTSRIENILRNRGSVIRFVMKGDADAAGDTMTVTAGQVLGVYRCRIPLAGRFLLFLKTLPGMAIFIFFPLGLFVCTCTEYRRQVRIERKREREIRVMRARLERERAKQNGTLIAGMPVSARQGMRRAQ